MSRELNGRQRLELSMLCIDFDDETAVATDPVAAIHDTMLALVRYVIAEGITPDQFSELEKLELNSAYLAALIVDDPSHCPPGSIHHNILVAAGVVPAS